MQPKQRRHQETAKRAEPQDDVATASMDSFPASDPPGWIDTEAHPVPAEDAASPKSPDKHGKKKATGKPHKK